MSGCDLQKRVSDELLWDAAITSNTVGVEAREGVVTLSGHVASYVEKWAAEKAAQRVPGVKAVVMELDVVLPGSSHRSDEDLAKMVRHMLDWNASVPGDSIKVSVDHGFVTLSGQVPWRYARSAAESIVRELVGVVGVSNLIEVAPKARLRDIEKKIHAALHRRAQLDAESISVDIEQSTVTLNGVVDSWGEREAAEAAVWNAPGVKCVVDNLVVRA